VEVGGGATVRDRGRLHDLAVGDRTEDDAPHQCLGRREGPTVGRRREVGIDRANVATRQHVARPEVAGRDDDGGRGTGAGPVVGDVHADRGKGHEQPSDHRSTARQPPMTLDLHGASRPLEEP